MSLYQDSCMELIEEGYTKELYRFEGDKTKSRIQLGENHPLGYIYVSNSLDHHKYFTMKRLKQMLNRVLQEEKKIPFRIRTIQNTEEYTKIKNLILYSDGLQPLYSYRLVCSKELDDLLRSYSVRNDQKEKDKRYIERVDRRVYGGGYGLGDEWQTLLNYMTLFFATTTISRKDLLEFLKNMRRTLKSNQKDNISFLGDLNRYQYFLNPYTLSDFNKYNITNVLESIVEKEMILPETELSVAPRKTIKRIVDNYERERERALEILERNYQSGGEEDGAEKKLCKVYEHHGVTSKTSRLLRRV